MTLQRQRQGVSVHGGDTAVLGSVEGAAFQSRSAAVGASDSSRTSRGTGDASRRPQHSGRGGREARGSQAGKLSAGLGIPTPVLQEQRHSQGAAVALPHSQGCHRRSQGGGLALAGGARSIRGTARWPPARSPRLCRQPRCMVSCRQRPSSPCACPDSAWHSCQAWGADSTRGRGRGILGRAGRG